MVKTLVGTTQIQLCLDRLRAGDAAARQQVIAYSCERLRRLTRKMLRDFPRLRRWEQTDDVFQEAVIRLNRALGEVQIESARQYFGLGATHIRRTLIDLARHHFGPEGPATHHHSDGYRRTAGDVRSGRALDEAVDPNSTEPETLEEWSRFHQAIDRLPPEEREVVHLIWYEGLMHSEAADVLGVDERTIRRRWRSAAILLHRSLGESP